MDLFILSLLSFLLGGGGNDLLDYVSSDLYWKAKQVTVSVETMIAELKTWNEADVAGWIEDLDSADARVRTLAYQRLLHAGPIVLTRLQKIIGSTEPEPARRAAALISRINAAPMRDSVRRLMAIRTLGELKNPQAAATLQSLLVSRETFVADYAAAAIAKIEGKSSPRARAQGSQDDAWLLPADYRAVLHLNLRTGHPLDYAEVFKKVPLGSNQDPASTADFIAGYALNLAESIGNVRLDAITAGASGDLDDHAGNIVFILAGRFDPAALETYAKKQKYAFQAADGITLFQLDADTTAFCPSDHRLIIIAAQKAKDAPLASMLAATKTGEGRLNESKDMADSIHAMDRESPVWGVIRTTPAYRKASELAPFDTLTVLGKYEGDGMQLVFQGMESPKLDDAGRRLVKDQIMEEIRKQVESLRRAQAVMPCLSVVADAMASVKVTDGDSVVTLKASVKQSPADSFVLPLMMIYGIPQRHQESLPKE